MLDHTKTTTFRRARAIVSAAAMIAATGMLAACGGSDEPASSNASGESAGLPAQIEVAYVADATGPAGPVGQADLKGMEAAVENAKRTGLIDSTIKINLLDSAGSAQKATTLTAQAAASDAVAVFGPAISSSGLAAAQIAQRREIPFLSVQANAPGLSDQGEYTYSATPFPSQYIDLATKYVKDEFDAKSAGFIYGNDSPALESGWKEFTKQFKDAGISVGENVGLPLTATDFTAAATRVARSKPDVVGVLLTAGQNAPAVTALRRAGFRGKIVAYNGAAGGYLKAAGEDAAGVPYAVSYGTGMPFESTKKFEELFAELNGGDQPNLFNAEGYAAMDLLLHALAASKDASRGGVIKGLQQVAASDGFDTSLGRYTLGSDNKRMGQSPGVLIVWDGKKETAVELDQQ